MAKKKKRNESGLNGPIFMSNLVKFRNNAEYEDGRETFLTSRQAYQIYGKPVLKMLPKYKAEVVFGSQITELLVGEAGNLWDEMTVLKYASRKDLNDMPTSQE